MPDNEEEINVWPNGGLYLPSQIVHFEAMPIYVGLCESASDESDEYVRINGVDMEELT